MSLKWTLAHVLPGALGKRSRCPGNIAACRNRQQENSGSCHRSAAIMRGDQRLHSGVHIVIPVCGIVAICRLDRLIPSGLASSILKHSCERYAADDKPAT